MSSKILNQVNNYYSEKIIKNGATPKHLRSLRRLYYDAVWKITEESWKNHFDQINPMRIRRSENALEMRVKKIVYENIS